MSQPQQFSYAEWLYHMDGGDSVWGDIQLWANHKQYRLPTEEPTVLKSIQSENTQS